MPRDIFLPSLVFLVSLTGCAGQSIGGYPQPASSDNARHYDDDHLAEVAHNVTAAQSMGAQSNVDMQSALPARKVWITSDPRNLILEDTVHRMIEGGALTPVDDAASADMIVKVEAYDFDYSNDDSDSEHISIAKYQIPNLVGAALFMPEASSYNVDIQRFRSSASFAFAYTISTVGKVEIGRNLIRDHIERDSTQCSQPTINNAFGGVVPAQFWASEQLQAECMKPGGRPSRDQLQAAAENEIGRQMRQQLINTELPKPMVKALKRRQKKKTSP